MKRHACHYRGSLDAFKSKTKGMEEIDPNPAPGGGLWFGYVQEGEKAMHWISAGEIEFLRPVLHVEGRHMGWHTDGEKLGKPRDVGPKPTRFEDGGAMTILVDAIEAHGRTSHLGRQLLEVLLDMRPRLAEAE